MSEHLKTIQELVQNNNQLGPLEKEELLKKIAEATRQYTIAEFKLERTEKIKHTTAILLEETIAELEQKRKAVEAQNRELEIETALEKVRSTALSMKSPEDMLMVCEVIAQQLALLNIRNIRNVQTAIIYESRGVYMNYEYFAVHGKTVVTEVEYNLQPDVAEFVSQMLKEPDAFFTKSFEGEDLKHWILYQDRSGQFMDPHLKSANSLHYYFYSIGPGALGISTYNTELDEQALALLKRFRNVFELAYRRFIDIELAISQAREARIEVAVERVRAKALAMHKSEEIMSVVAKLRYELIALEIPGVTAATIYLEEENGNIRLWDLTGLTESEHGFLLKLDLVIQLQETDPDLWFQKIWKSKEKYFIVKQDRKDLERTLVWLRQYDPEAADNINRELEENNIEHGWHPTVQLEKGRLSIDLIQPPPDEIEPILLKMGAAFDLAYRRFLDLQKAEAQTREARIEASLERVRSKAMAMHSSEDLAAAIGVFYRELESFSITPRRCGVGLLNKETRIAELSTMNTTSDGTSIEIIGKLKMEGHPVLEGVFDNWLLQKEFHPVLKGNEIKEYYQLVRPQIAFPDYPSDVIQFGYFFFFPEGGVYAWTDKELGEEELKIYRRFTSVLSLTYRRYKDLMDAEAQTRESQIEAALERVRAKVMAMTSSDDLNDTSLVFGEQLKKIGIDWQFSYFWLVDEAKGENTFWITWPDYRTSITVYTIQEAEEYFNDCLVSWRAGVKVHDNYVPPGDVQGWIDTFQRIAEDAGGRAIEIMVPQTFPNGVYYYDAMMKYGSFGICVNRPATDEEKNIQSRFAVEFERAYTRFLDLQKAEDQAREAQIELGLERVRARAMAMQRSEELNALIGSVFTELTRLDVVLTRCIIMIYDAGKNGFRWWMANSEAPESPMNFFVQYHDLRFFRAYYDAWQNRTNKWLYVLEGNDKVEVDDFLFNYTELSQLPEHFKAGMKAPDLVYLNVSFNNFGNITLASLEPLPEEHFDIFLRFAKVFDLTYTRFNDLKLAEKLAEQAELDLIKLKEEKQRTENALAELKAAQSQLIQSEKMASLGELTAGIAHEIQNPLNFVNNFSEVSNELIEEMVAEIKNKNYDEVASIAGDVKQNLEKILHHGKRADGIVKGMLQHSRNSSGGKESTDINVLADEYLRLAYHGLRAKEKTFNATMKTDYDQHIGSVNVMPQEIGRVILNLITNAFYAVNEKKKAMMANATSGQISYEPTVSISTKKSNQHLEIKVSDNGNGIPARLLDKIFQPFFTTKPAGQGTGLGLSLSYDIMKAHGGELKVRTTENEGTEFVILLPVQ